MWEQFFFSSWIWSGKNTIRKISPPVVDIQLYSMCLKFSTKYRWKHSSKDIAIHRGKKEGKAFIIEENKRGGKGNNAVQNLLCITNTMKPCWKSKLLAPLLRVILLGLERNPGILMLINIPGNSSAFYFRIILESNKGN